MSDKFDSLVIILNRIDSKSKVTAESLQDELERSKRTIHRYIRTLVTAGFPVEYDRNNKTYAFADGYTLKKPHLSLEESLAFSLAKKVLSNFGPGMEKSLTTIEEKLGFKSPQGLKYIIFSPEPVPKVTEKYLVSIHQAITDHRKIKLGYQAFAAKKPTTSTVNPYYLFFRDGIWYFRGYYEADRAARTFALDRITSLTLLDTHFLPPDLEPEDDLSGAFGAFIDGEPVDVVLKFDEKYKPLILRKTWHPSQQVQELPDGSLEVKFNVKGLQGIRKWTYQWIPYVEVIAPKELRDTFRDDMKISLKKHT